MFLAINPGIISASKTPRIDTISDGKDTFTATVMEHIELAGVHSRDSACVIPPRTTTDENIRIIKEYTAKMGRALGAIGLMNIRYAIAGGKVYILEANPRASRTVPLVSKVTGIPLVFNVPVGWKGMDG